MSLEMKVGMQITYGAPGETERTKMRTAEIIMTITEAEWLTRRKEVMWLVVGHIDSLFNGAREVQQARRVAGPREKLP